MSVCGVKVCSNSQKKFKKGSEITFHAFPSDPVVASKWIRNIRLSRRDEYWKPSKCSLVCSAHFEDKYKYMTNQGLSKLRKDAVPTMHLHIGCPVVYHNDDDIVDQPRRLPLPDLDEHKDLSTNLDSNAPPNIQIEEVKQDGLYFPQLDLKISCSEYYNDFHNEIKSLQMELSPCPEYVTSGNPTLDTVNKTKPCKRNISQESSEDELELQLTRPHEALLRKKLKAKTDLQQKHRKVIKSLQSRNKALLEKNAQLKNKLTLLYNKCATKSLCKKIKNKNK